MEQGTQDCINNCKKYGLHFVTRSGLNAKYDDQNDEEEKCEDDANDEEFTEDEDLITDDLYDDENDTLVTRRE